MEVLVFVEPTDDGFRAVPLSSADLVGTGRTEADACIALATRLRGGRVLRVEVPDPPTRRPRDPVAEAALTRLAAAPPEVWQAYRDAVAENRRREDADAADRERTTAAPVDVHLPFDPSPASAAL